MVPKRLDILLWSSMANFYNQELFYNYPGQSDFFHKKGGVGKTGVVLKKGVSLIFIPNHSNVIFLRVRCACVCFAYLYYLYQYSLCFMEIILILLNLINRYVTSTSEQLLKSKETLKKKILDISKIFIQCHTHSSQKYITGDAKIYLYTYKCK